MKIELTNDERALSFEAVEWSQEAMPASFKADVAATVSALEVEEEQDLTARQANIILKSLNNRGFILSRLIGSNYDADYDTVGSAYDKILAVVFARVEELNHDYEAVVREITPEEVLQNDGVLERTAEGLRSVHDESQHAVA